MKTMKLEQGQTYLNTHPRPLLVKYGKVWLTIEGDATDYILCEGESFSATPNQSMLNQSVLLQGLEQALILFTTEL